MSGKGRIAMKELSACEGTVDPVKEAIAGSGFPQIAQIGADFQELTSLAERVRDSPRGWLLRILQLVGNLRKSA